MQLKSEEILLRPRAKRYPVPRLGRTFVSWSRSLKTSDQMIALTSSSDRPFEHPDKIQLRERLRRAETVIKAEKAVRMNFAESMLRLSQKHYESHLWDRLLGWTKIVETIIKEPKGDIHMMTQPLLRNRWCQPSSSPWDYKSLWTCLLGGSTFQTSAETALNGDSHLMAFPTSTAATGMSDIVLSAPNIHFGELSRNNTRVFQGETLRVQVNLMTVMTRANMEKVSDSAIAQTKVTKKDGLSPTGYLYAAPVYQAQYSYPAVQSPTYPSQPYIPPRKGGRGVQVYNYGFLPFRHLPIRRSVATGD
ncbi:hypothetical protein C8J56DRAFT_879796 [Mycena floridula]|nr:hypothetical protein C8J56DRAFT_879796 [Mycena floridula]